MKRFYLDACIWRDYFEDREDRFRPLGEWAFRLIKKIIEDGDLFVISDVLIEELREPYTSEEIKNLFEIVPKKLSLKIEYSKKQLRRAFEIKNKFNIPFKDALHSILAKDNNAILITRDKHFYELIGEVDVRKPEDLI